LKNSNVLAEEAVISELVSVGIFPVKQENTGKLRRSSRKGGKRLGFSDYKSASYAQIPYAPEQGIFWS
jgi:hypothetical protein